MILINLLPDEYRRKGRTPVKFMALTAGAVTINASLLAFWAWTAFGIAAEVKAELQVLRDTDTGLAPQVAYHRELETESQLFESREQTLRNLTTARVSWTEQVDTLIDIINRGGDSDKEQYLIWLDSLDVDMKENARSGTYGKLKASGHSGSSSFAQVANFLEDIENSGLKRNFFKPYPPSGTQQKKDEELIPSETWDFPLEMDLKAPKDRQTKPAQDSSASGAGNAANAPNTTKAPRNRQAQ